MIIKKQVICYHIHDIFLLQRIISISRNHTTFHLRRKCACFGKKADNFEHTRHLCKNAPVKIGTIYGRGFHDNFQFY